MSLRIIQLFIALVFISEPLLAGGGSLYSRFGVGDVQYFVSPQAIGMGGAGLATGSSKYINAQNPSLLGYIDQTRISGQILFSTHSLESDFSSATQTEGNFNGTALAIPIDRFVVSVGLYPYSLFNYDQSETGKINVPTGEAVSYQSDFEGTGGLSTIPISFGIHLMESPSLGSLYFGTAYNFIFGTFEKNVTTEYSDFSYETSEKYERDNVNGANYTLGFTYEFPKGLLLKNDKLSIGGFYSAKETLNADREIILSTAAGTDTIQTDNGNDLTIPQRFGLGLAYAFNSKLMLAFDYQTQKWSSLKFFDDDVSFRKNASRVGGGIEYEPTSLRRSGFFKKLTYRLGAYVLNHNIKIQNEAINEYGFTLGFGIPLADGNSIIDIGLEYALKGTRDAQLIQEDIFRISISMSAGDTWFLEPIIQ